ncbi:hypothetical protein BH09BAC1_BH09BAC1_15530 [soil metagenome]
MLAGLDCAALISFKVSKVDASVKLHWEHSKEFEYQGEWYDVVYTDTLDNDSLQYWLLWDNDETMLNRQLASLVANALGHDPATKHKTERFNHFSKDIFCIDIPTFKNPLFAYSELRYSLAGAPLNRPTVPLAPPPEIVEA